jgi:hypothetical protein
MSGACKGCASRQLCADLRVVCVWYACGMRVVCVWYACGMRVVCVWYACGMRVVCVWYEFALVCVVRCVVCVVKYLGA